MAGFISRLVACLVAVVALLQLTHLVLLNKLESRRLAEIQHHQIVGTSGGGGSGSAAVHGAGGSDRRTIDSFINGRQRRSQTQSQAQFQATRQSQQKRHIITSEKLGLDSTGEFRIIYNVGKKPTATVNPSVEDKVDATLNQAQTSSDSILVPITGYAYAYADMEAATTGAGGGGDPGTGRARIRPKGALPLPPANSNSGNDEDSANEFDVTLISASDLNSARQYLITLVERWKGPISLTLFAHSATEAEDIIQFMSTLQTCHAEVKQFVSYHLVYPASSQDFDPRQSRRSRDNERLLSEQPNLAQNLLPMMCQNFYKNLLPFVQEQELYNANNAPNAKSVLRKFPINLLRNVARSTVTTKYSFVIDIDLLPSNGLRTQFQDFIRSRSGRRRRRGRVTTQPQPPGAVVVDDYEHESKVVFVVPAFETKNGEIPGSKFELLSLLDSYQARPYYFDLCWKCQVHTDYESWQRESPSSRNELSVLFEVLWKDPWEPFFISSNQQVPFYDERFQTEFGYHRLSQLCELHMNGYKFAVLNDAFLIHPNFKTLEAGGGGSVGARSTAAVLQPASALYPDERNHNLEVNRVHFENFKNEMGEKYPQSTRRCY